jgi:hypothetical protein
MKRRDLFIVLLVPSLLILLPVAGNATVEGWNWTWRDFIVAWALFAATTLFFRYLATRPAANFAYKAGAALGVTGGFLVTWITMAVQVIGEENPGNVLYLLTVLAGFAGVFAARFRPAGLARVAFGMAAALLCIPVVAVFLWPADFSPGFARVFVLNGGFVTLFTASGLCFRHAAGRAAAAKA